MTNDNANNQTNGNGDNGKATRDALRRLLIIIGVVIGFTVYSFGWTVTEIDLEKPQEEQRQQNLQRSLRELFAPRIFHQERNTVDLTADFRVSDDCDAADVPESQEPNDDGERYIILEPTCGDVGDEVFVQVGNHEPLADARVRWLPPGDAQSRPREIQELERQDFVLSQEGTFSGTITVPRIRGTEDQVHQVALRTLVPAGPLQFSDTMNNVVNAMVETIFMALVATTVAIPIAALISFLAARNLMRPIRLPLGSMLLALIALPFGWLIGTEALYILGDIGLSAGDAAAGAFTAHVDPDESAALAGSDWLNIALTFVLPFVVVFAVSQGLRAVALWRVTEGSFYEAVKGSLNQIVIVLGLVFFLGAVGGLGVLGGQQIIHMGESTMLDVEEESESVFPGDSGESEEAAESESDQPGGFALWLRNLVPNGIRAIGQFFSVLGQLLQLFMVPIAGLLGAFVFSGIVTNLTRDAIQQVGGLWNYAAGALLGGISGMMLLGLVTEIGRSAALLGLLTPIVAAILGGQLVVMIYFRTIAPATKAGGIRTISDNLMRTILFYVGAIVVFAFTFDRLNVFRALIDGTLPPLQTVEVLGIELSRYVWDGAFIGLVLGGLSGVVSGLHRNFPLGSVMYNVSRTALNSVRSIEPLIMGLVFVIWVGIGPFAGVLALTLHSIAALGKLYSEQVENIDSGPIEAVQATGANRLQTIVYAVVPQIIPPYIAFTMYRWDINVRMSTIIGFVGGGGIGLLLQQQINLLQYRDAGVAVLAIAVVVSILDYASAYIRERLT